MLQKLMLFVCFAAPSVALAAPKAPGNLVYMHEQEAQKRIMIADADGTNVRPLTPEGTWGLYPEISSDGRFVAYSGGADEAHLGILVHDLGRRSTEQWTPQDGLYLHSELSGDGRFLAFSGPLGENAAQRVAIIDLERERARGPISRGDVSVYRPELKIIPSEHPSYFPALSSSGAFLVFQRSKGATKDLVMHTIQSGETKAISPEDGYAMAPALSFDDRFVVYTAKVDGKWDLYLFDLWTNERKQITDTPYLDYAPTFRADGSIVFAANPSGHFELFGISAASIQDGSFTSAPLVLGEGDHYAPSLSGETDHVIGLKRAISEPARSSFGAIAHGEKIFVAGGHQGPEHTYPPESFMDRLDIYDKASNSWQQGASLSLARHGFGLAAHGNYVYAFGGFTYSEAHRPKWKSVDLIERYDIDNDRWEVIGHLPRPRSSNVVAQVGTKVYLLGGWDSTPQGDGDADGRFHRTIDVFDLETELVTTLEQTLPDPLRRALSGVVHGNEILLVGGLGVGASHFELLDRVTAFNVETNSWRELPRLPFATFAPATGIVDGDLYVFGGMFKTGPMAYEYVNHIYGLTIEAGAWRHAGRHLRETKGFGQVVDLAPGTLAILGGHTYVGDADHPVATFETFGK